MFIIVQDESVILDSVTCLNDLLRTDDKNWDLGTNACKSLADVLRTGKHIH
jgi:hypothetical protein